MNGVFRGRHREGNRTTGPPRQVEGMRSVGGTDEEIRAVSPRISLWLHPTTVRERDPRRLGRERADRAHALLATPFFLDLRLTRAAGPTDAVTLKSEELEAYLRSSKMSNEALDALSEAAWNIYSTERSIGASEKAWVEAGLNATVLAVHVGDGLMTQSVAEEGRVQLQFRHQLIHDHLVSRRLACMQPEGWRAPRFDVATLDASSFDALSLAAEQIEAVDLLIEFLREMYDWNYRAGTA